MYQGFAAVYDFLMRDVDYEGWADYYAGLAAQNGAALGTAVDCGCGTGSMTIALMRRGLRMTGIDSSPEMLSIAGEKARRAGVFIPFARQDMRRLALHRPVDCVFSCCDGVNYLQEPAYVQAFFRAAHAQLRPGGRLLFDVSTEHKLGRVLGDHCLGGDDAQVAYIWQNHYDAGKRMLQMDLTFFVQEADGRYRRFSETHRQRAHTREELEAWLLEAGFGGVAFYGDRTLLPPAEREQRMHVAAVRV